jgi:hypothetical protein
MNYLNCEGLVQELTDVITNVEGSALVGAFDSVLRKYDDLLTTTPLPATVADWLDDLITLFNECEGAELEREVQALEREFRAFQK